MSVYVQLGLQDTTGVSHKYTCGMRQIYKHFMLKDVGMEVPKSVETRKHPCSKTGDDGMQQ